MNATCFKFKYYKVERSHITVVLSDDDGRCEPVSRSLFVELISRRGDDAWYDWYVLCGNRTLHDIGD